MSEEGSVSYKDGDIVWVKLGSAWWPGEVTENAPEECNSSFRKPPLCIVKFFNESTFEFVKSLNNIYPYNCERKNEFIKKGMDSYRANNVHMEKFPIDVSLAEVKTDGNPEILSDPLFVPQKKKLSIVSEVFGSPTLKKANKDGLNSSRGRPSKGSQKKSKVHITHRRFLGFDDYEAHIRVQYPGKDKSEQAEDGEEVDFKDEPTKTYPCSSCHFTTDRLEVMFIHVQAHIQGISTPRSGKKKTKKQKKPKIARKAFDDEDRIPLSSSESEAEIVKPKQKRKRKSQGPSKKTKQKKTEEVGQVDIRSNLLAEWSDSGSEDDEETDTSKANISAEDKTSGKKDEDVDKSCFDFNDDEEEEDSGVVHTAVGRKIPRVIPPATDRRKSSDPDTEDASLPLAEDDENRMEILKVNENLNSNEGSGSTNNDDDANKESAEFKDLMDSTSIPEVPEVPDSKVAQNFPSGKTIKFPDKSEVATKLTNPKKRFVKSFEDFEQLQNEQRKAQEVKEQNNEKPKEETTTTKPIEEKKEDSAETKPTEDEDVEKKDETVTTKSILDGSLQISKLRGQIMSKLGDDDADSHRPRRGSPRTPRSKILESYNEEKKRRRSAESKKDEKPTVENAKEKEKQRAKQPPTKKSKYLKFKPDPESEDEKKEETVESEEPTPKRTPKKKEPVIEEKKKEPVIEKKKKEPAIEEKKPETVIIEEKKEEPVIIEEKKKEPVIEKRKREAVIEKKKKEPAHEKKRKGSVVIEEKKEEAVIEEQKKEPIIEQKKESVIDEKKKEPLVEEVKMDPVIEEPKPETVTTREMEKSQTQNEKIDDYFNFLTNLDEPNSEEVLTTTVVDNSTKVEDPNEVHIKCAGNDEDSSSLDLDIAIKTNLSNFSKSDDEMSALTTLAAVSEMKTNIDNGKVFEEQFLKAPPIIPNEELVTIDGNLTVVSEKDLGDGQVEITADTSMNNTKPVTLTTFSMDFSDSNNDSTIAAKQVELSVDGEVEVTAQKTIGVIKKDDVINQKETKSVEIEEEIIPQPETPIVAVVKDDKVKKVIEKPTSKLLERLTTDVVKPKENSSPKYKVQSIYGLDTKGGSVVGKDSPKVFSSAAKNAKFIVKPVTGKTSQSSRPIILSEKIIKPERPADSVGNVSVQKVTSKKIMQDADEIDTFIIHKGAKTAGTDDEGSSSSVDAIDELLMHRIIKKPPLVDPIKKQIITPTVKKPIRGKAKILQQTIITAAGDIIQPGQQQQQQHTVDDSDFDINSMPIVMGDQILTPESIEHMPIYLSDSVPTVQTTEATVTTSATITKPIIKKIQQPQMRLLNKSMSSSPVVGSLVDTAKTAKVMKTSKIIGTVPQKIIKQNSFSSPGGAAKGKYVLVSQAATTSTTPQASKYTVGKRPIKRPEIAGTLTKVQNLTPEPSGNKIMILTNQQGQQQRVLLTPAQQKLIGYQTPGSKTTKTVVKGNIMQKGKDVQMAAIAGSSSSGLVQKVVSTSAPRVGHHQVISTSGHVMTPVSTQGKPVQKTIGGRRVQVQPPQKVVNKPMQKTILIKNQHGQTVRKIQGTDDALLDQQVAEQIEAIKASGGLQQMQQPHHHHHHHQQQKQEILNYNKVPPRNYRKSYVKRPAESPKLQTKTLAISTAPSTSGVNKEPLPPLAPISPIKKVEAAVAIDKSPEGKKDRPLNQLVIQDAMGNQTTITEGQILALPSETIDGQPQSYMLVTLDESGNLTPLNNEALMSLDPNLGLGGDLNNTVLQIDQSALKEEASETVVTESESVKLEVAKVAEPEVVPVAAPKEKEEPLPEIVPEVSQPSDVIDPVPVSVSASESTGQQQQLIVTGDPIAAQKFLESLTEGNTDLANILANAEGSILIHADGQQILINTDSDNQMLLSMNADSLGMAESTEGGGNPIFATSQPSKNQDILAAALADTDVFQPEAGTSQGKSQLSPNSALYPMNVGNVLETSLTLNSPIMTPLEVPSAKKIVDEADILSQVTKNVDLPITITDPNISHTVSQQQMAAQAVANDLQNNLELSLQDPAISAPSTEMNSPSFSYSLPSLDESDMGQKPFNSSMPLLTEDAEESLGGAAKAKSEEKVDVEGEESEASTSTQVVEETTIASTSELKSDEDKLADAHFLEETEGLCTLGGEMCSSLSEPPPDMFDLSAVLAAQIKPKDVVVDEGVKEDSSESKVEEPLSNVETNSTVTTSSSPTSANEDSSEIEIPVQPEIVTNLNDLGGANNKRGSDDQEDQQDGDSKKCKFD